MPLILSSASPLMKKVGFATPLVESLEGWIQHQQNAFGNQNYVEKTGVISIRTAPSQPPILTRNVAPKTFSEKTKTAPSGLLYGMLPVTPEAALVTKGETKAIGLEVDHIEFGFMKDAGRIVPVPGHPGEFFDSADLAQAKVSPDLKGADVESLRGKLPLYEFQEKPNRASQDECVLKREELIVERPYLEAEIRKHSASDEGQQYQVMRKKPGEQEQKQVQVVGDAFGRRMISDADLFIVQVPKFEFFNHFNKDRLTEAEYKKSVQSMDTNFISQGVLDAGQKGLSEAFYDDMRRLQTFFNKNGSPVFVPEPPNGVPKSGKASPYDILVIHNINILNAFNLLKQEVQIKDKAEKGEFGKPIPFTGDLAKIRDVVIKCNGLSDLVELHKEYDELGSMANPSPEQFEKFKVLHSFWEQMNSAQMRAIRPLQHGQEAKNPLDVEKVKTFSTPLYHISPEGQTYTESVPEARTEVFNRKCLEENLIELNPTWFNPADEYKNAGRDDESAKLAKDISESMATKVRPIALDVVVAQTFGGSHKEGFASVEDLRRSSDSAQRRNSQTPELRDTQQKSARQHSRSNSLTASQLAEMRAFGETKTFSKSGSLFTSSSPTPNETSSRASPEIFDAAPAKPKFIRNASHDGTRSFADRAKSMRGSVFGNLSIGLPKKDLKGQTAPSTPTGRGVGDSPSSSAASQPSTPKSNLGALPESPEPPTSPKLSRGALGASVNIAVEPKDEKKDKPGEGGSSVQKSKMQ